MRQFSIAPSEIALGFWTHRGLILNLTRRDVYGRYRGSAVGVLWSLLHPLLLLLVYTFVFGVVFKARWGTESDSLAHFALVLFAGLMAFNLFAECINRAPGLVVSNTNYVKRVVFPLEVLPWVSLGSALFHYLASLAVWLVFYALIIGLPSATILLLPLVLLPMVLLVMGLSWLLASLGVYLRDVSFITGIATTVLLFLSPVFYPASAIPPDYRPLLAFNPMAVAIEQARAVMLQGQVPPASHLAAQFVVSSLVAWLGFGWFQKTRKGFADVI